MTLPDEPSDTRVRMTDEPRLPLQRPRTPIAAAIRHEPAAPAAPRLVAAARGPLADRLVELAFAHGVKVREDADLAEILAAVDVDSPIPFEAFAAVAEVLAYVYMANAKARGDAGFGAPEEDAR
jgi:flagellar biosynthesis protein